MDDRNMKDPSNEIEQVSFQMVQTAMAPYEGLIRTFGRDEKEPISGIQASEAPGLTPGHTAYFKYREKNDRGIVSDCGA